MRSLKLSFDNDENQFAIPREKYILKTNSSSDLEIMTLPWKWSNLNDLFGYNVQGLPTAKLNQMIPIELYCPS